VLKLLAHPERLRILMELVDGEKCVGDLTNCCESSQSQTSQFLMRLKLEGLLEHRRDGRSVYYRIADLRIISVLQALRRCFC
jgi:DNA-binding transcriptional ArsR family regulator